MTVTIVCDVLGAANNGTTIAAMNLINSLRGKGHEVRIICPDSDKNKTNNFYVVPVYNFGPLNGYVKKNGVTIAKPDDGIIRAAISGADVVHIMTPFMLGRRAARLARQEGIPVSAGFHAMAENLTVHLFLKNCAPINRLTYKYYSGLYRHCDAIHYPTQFLRDLYESMYGKTNGYVISNGVNPDIHPIDTEKPEEYRNKYVILFTGRYSGEKSHKILMDAVTKSAHADSIQLIFAGDGPLKEELKEYSKKLTLPPVFSFFSRADMVRILNYSDLYVHPAEIEAEGIACLEAIACGLVPVISDSPRCATKAYAIDGRNLFRYDSPEDLAQKIDWWLDHPDEKAKRSEEYINYAGNNFDLSVCMDKMENMLKETAALKST